MKSVPRSDPADKISFALAALKAGFKLLPLAPRSKVPYGDLLPRDRHGKPSWKILTKRPATEADVRAWFAFDPEASYGILAGAVSGLVVFDVDNPDRFPPGIEPSVTVLTRKGFHLYHRTTARAVPSKTEPWGDLKADGGYVVGPGCLHPHGGVYAFAPGHSFTWPPMADAPAQFLKNPVAASGNSADHRPRTKSFSDRTKSANPDRYQEKVSRLGTHARLSLQSDAFSPARGLLDFAADPEACAALVQAWTGTRPSFYDGDLGTASTKFCCPLPGHDEQTGSPSAALWRGPTHRGFMVRCFHDRDWWPLPAIYRGRVSGLYDPKLTRSQLVVWWVRCLADHGLVDLPPVLAPPLPPEAPASAKAVYRGLVLRHRIGLALTEDPRAGFTFTWRFGSTWCATEGREMPQRTVRYGLAWLKRREYLPPIAGGTGWHDPTRFTLGHPGHVRHALAAEPVDPFAVEVVTA